MESAAHVQRPAHKLRDRADRPRVAGGASDGPAGTFFPPGLDVAYGISDGTPPTVTEAFPAIVSSGARLLRRSKLETLLGA